MIANYHTHTKRCGHAWGSEREYVEHAIEGGLKILGFSDHTPYPFPGNFKSGIRMEMEELEGYMDTVLSLKQEYRGEIEIHLGLEVEYYPAVFGKLLDAAKDYPIEYFLLAQHFLDNEYDTGIYSGTPTDSEAILAKYFDQLTEAMETGAFTYLAHPDLIRFTGDSHIYEQQARRFCRRAKALGLPLEINFLGLMDHRHYPRDDFWLIAGQEGCCAVFGADAHAPQNVWDPETLTVAEQLAGKYSLQVLDTVELVNPNGHLSPALSRRPSSSSLEILEPGLDFR